MCQIALSKSTEKVLIKKKMRGCVIFVWAVWVIFFTTITAVTTVKKYFLGTFGKRNFTHLTTDVMFSGPHFAIIAMFSQ